VSRGKRIISAQIMVSRRDRTISSRIRDRTQTTMETTREKRASPMRGRRKLINTQPNQRQRTCNARKGNGKGYSIRTGPGITKHTTVRKRIVSPSSSAIRVGKRKYCLMASVIGYGGGETENFPPTEDLDLLVLYYLIK